MTITAPPAPAAAPVLPTLARPGSRPSTPVLRALRYEPAPDHGPAVAGHAGAPPPTVPDDLREDAALRRRAHQVLCLVLEAVDGRRPLAHLGPHLDPQALRYVRAAVGGRPGRPPSRLTSLHLRRPRPDAVEVAAVHRTGDRARAVAARFEGRPDAPGSWRCVSVRLL